MSYAEAVIIYEPLRCFEFTVQAKVLKSLISDCDKNVGFLLPAALKV